MYQVAFLNFTTQLTHVLETSFQHFEQIQKKISFLFVLFVTICGADNSPEGKIFSGLSDK